MIIINFIIYFYRFCDPPGIRFEFWNAQALRHPYLNGLPPPTSLFCSKH